MDAGGDDGVYLGGGGGEYGLLRLSKKELFCGCWNMQSFLLQREYLQTGDISCKNLHLSP